MSEREQIVQDLLEGLARLLEGQALTIDAVQRLLALDASVVVHLPQDVTVTMEDNTPHGDTH